MRLRKTPEEKAALQARKQQKLAAWQARSEANRAERKRRYEEKHNPVTQARLAFERGDPVFQYELHGIFDDQKQILIDVCNEGWELVQATGEKPTAMTSGFNPSYTLKRCEENRARTP